MYKSNSRESTKLNNKTNCKSRFWWKRLWS